MSIVGCGGTKFTRATGELSPAQIIDVYGGLIKRATTAFTTDLSYVVEMAERSSLIEYKHRLWQIRTEVDCDDEREKLLRDRGITPPARLSASSRRKKRVLAA